MQISEDTVADKAKVGISDLNFEGLTDVESLASEVAEVGENAADAATGGADYVVDGA